LAYGQILVAAIYRTFTHDGTLTRFRLCMSQERWLGNAATSQLMRLHIDGTFSARLLPEVR